jgi:hypothetical protein
MSHCTGLPVVTDTAKFPHWEDGILVFGRANVEPIMVNAYGAHRCPSFGWGWRYGWLSECPDCGGERFEHGSGI